jgi:hypothetical protein
MVRCGEDQERERQTDCQRSFFYCRLFFLSSILLHSTTLKQNIQYAFQVMLLASTAINEQLLVSNPKFRHLLSLLQTQLTPEGIPLELHQKLEDVRFHC